MDIMFECDDDVVVFGQDVGYFGGVFCCIEGLQKKYGILWVFDVLIFESGIIGVVVGMGVYGLCLVVEIQFVDYVYLVFDQLIFEVVCLCYCLVGDFIVLMIVCMFCGGGIYGGQMYSQSLEVMFIQVCGLCMVMLFNFYDVKGLLIVCIENDDLVIFFEFKCFYNGLFDGYYDCLVMFWFKYLVSQVLDGYYKVLLDKVVIVCFGVVLIVLIYGIMVYVVQVVVDEIGLDVEIIDLCSFWLLDLEIIVVLVKKIGCCVIVYEVICICGFGVELMLLVQEYCFYYLEVLIECVIGWDIFYLYVQEWVYFFGFVCVGVVFKCVMEV